MCTGYRVPKAVRLLPSHYMGHHSYSNFTSTLDYLLRVFDYQMVKMWLLRSLSVLILVMKIQIKLTIFKKSELGFSEV